MSKNKKINTESIAAGLSSAVGSLMGTVSANAAINKIKDIEHHTEENIGANNTVNSDDIDVISFSHENIQGNVIEQPSPAHITTNSAPTETPAPIIVEPEPNTNVDLMYAGPDSETDPIEIDIEPIVCVYGPPEPDFLNDIDGPTNDFLADI